MKDRCIILATATLLISSGIASAQTPARDLPDAANPSAAGPAPNNASTETADPAAIIGNHAGRHRANRRAESRRLRENAA
jgi:hypothetical protein